MTYYFFITEGWLITLIVLTYVIWAYTNPRFGALLRIVVPFTISLAAHVFMLVSGRHVSVQRCISDIGYDWLAPIGIYGICKEIMDHHDKLKNLKNLK